MKAMKPGLRDRDFFLFILYFFTPMPYINQNCAIYLSVKIVNHAGELRDSKIVRGMCGYADFTVPRLVCARDPLPTILHNFRGVRKF